MNDIAERVVKSLDLLGVSEYKGSIGPYHFPYDGAARDVGDAEYGLHEASHCVTLGIPYSASHLIERTIKSLETPRRGDWNEAFTLAVEVLAGRALGFDFDAEVLAEYALPSMQRPATSFNYPLRFTSDGSNLLDLRQHQVAYFTRLVKRLMKMRIVRELADRLVQDVRSYM